jgi:hypothetical protein
VHLNHSIITNRLLKKPSMAFFNIAIRTPLSRIPAPRGIETSCLETAFSNCSHFQWLSAIKNVGKSFTV